MADLVASQEGLVVRLAAGLLASGLIAGVALYRRSLSRSGGLAALMVGAAIFAFGGATWFAALLVFFVTSTALGRVGKAKKAETKRRFEKTDTRDAIQVLCNGGVAATCAVGHALWPSPLWLTAFLSALATANADTWATELGVLSTREPLSLTSLRRVRPGTSGAVSGLGLAATFAGALVIATFAFPLHAEAPLPVAAAAALAGSAGSLIDSLIGATLQASHHCPRCDETSEAHVHACGTRCRHFRGLRWLGNDLVNLAATSAGAALGAAGFVCS